LSEGNLAPMCGTNLGLKFTSKKKLDLDFWIPFISGTRTETGNILIDFSKPEHEVFHKQ
jgi:hypothetical protein